MASLWVGLVVGVPTWYLAATLVEVGMAWWQGLLTVLAGNLLVLIPMLLNGHPGCKYGVPFPVLARAAFGVKGANLPSLLRGLVACGWFGIQTWIGGSAILQLVTHLPAAQGAAGAAALAAAPNLPGWFGGVTYAELGCFLVFWVGQLGIVWRGIECIRHLESASAPVLLLAGGLGPMLSAPSLFAPGGPKHGQFWKTFFPALTANVGFWATLSLNIPDFTRYSRSQASQAIGQALGLPVTMVAFAFVGLAVTSATLVVFGPPAIPDPVLLLSKIPGLLPSLLACTGLCLATLTTNIAANVVAPANALVNLAPRRVSFAAGATVTALAGLLLAPWRLVRSPADGGGGGGGGAFFAWLVAYSALLGPIAGVLVADYFLLRKTELDVDGLYSLDPSGPYWYAGGYNPAAVFALVAGVLPNLPGFLAAVAHPRERLVWPEASSRFTPASSLPLRPARSHHTGKSLNLLRPLAPIGRPVAASDEPSRNTGRRCSHQSFPHYHRSRPDYGDAAATLAARTSQLNHSNQLPTLVGRVSRNPLVARFHSSRGRCSAASHAADGGRDTAAAGGVSLGSPDLLEATFEGPTGGFQVITATSVADNFDVAATSVTAAAAAAAAAAAVPLRAADDAAVSWSAGSLELDGLIHDEGLRGSDLVPRGEEEATTAKLQGSNLATTTEAGFDEAGKVESVRKDARWSEEVWEQARSVVSFAGPAMGIWLSHPIMSLIDTAVVGQGCSTELAALGPGTVMCDQVSFLFMFLSIATSNLIATAMAQQDTELASRHLSQLLFVALVCGLLMTAVSLKFVPQAIAGFVGNNTSIIPAACVYAKIRAYAWPAVLVTSVAQSASLGLQDVWGPLRCLAVASAVNLGGDLLLCPLLGYGIAGAAWATMASQYVGALLMLHSLHRAGRIRLAISPPPLPELLTYLSLTGPIFVTLAAKVGFYTLLTFQATSLGTVPLAAHQVLVGVFALCAVCAEPLSQTAQSFLPSLCVGVNRNMHKARRLLMTLILIAALLGAMEVTTALFVSLRMPSLFTADPAVISQIACIAPALAVSLMLNPIVLSSEGALLVCLPSPPAAAMPAAIPAAIPAAMLPCPQPCVLPCLLPCVLPCRLPWLLLVSASVCYSGTIPHVRY
ncbi:unnamed protein product [Closterium sp. NIES-64]|nr:unnamed protein product [Closterium sp. NIES-64]